MDKDISNKIEDLVKSMYKTVKALKKKNALEDVLDEDRVAEVDPDLVPADRTGSLNKKKKEEVKKTEDFVKSVMDNFEVISKAYMMEKAKIDTKKFPDTDSGFASKRRQERANRKEGFQPKTREKIPQATPEGKKPRELDVGQARSSSKLKDRLQSKYGKQPSKEDLEYPMASSEDNRCWEGYKPTPGKKSYSEGSCQKKSESSEKPFHGYNKKRHSKEGGLSEDERNRINRETGSNLKAPVSSKEAKKSPKKASRRKSFCARMKGVKGATSKEGKLTPKGAALKRWDC